MPTVSTFRGIYIRIYYHDHSPPHFHALYQGMEAKIAIDTLDVIDGQLPPRIVRLISGWAEVRRPELQDNWLRALRRAPLIPIPALE
jgi:hypothetical protein